MNCSSCSGTLGAADRFCPRCGAPVSGLTGPAATTAPPTVKTPTTMTPATTLPTPAVGAAHEGADDWTWLRTNAVSGGILFAVVVGAAIVITISTAIGLSLLGTGSSSPASTPGGTSTTDQGPASLIGWILQTAAMLVGGNLSLQSGGVAGGATLFLMPGLGTMAVAVAANLVGRLRRQSITTPRESLRAAAIVAGIPVLGLIVVALIFPVPAGFVTISAQPAALVFLGFPIMFVATFVGLVRSFPVALPTVLHRTDQAGARRALAAITCHALTVWTVLIVVDLIYAVIKVGAVKTLGGVFLIPALGVNALVMETGLVHGGSVGGSATVGVFQSASSVSPFSSQLAPWGPLLLVVALLGTVVAGVRVGLGMPSGWDRQWRDAWITPLAFLLGWLVLITLFGRISLSGSVVGIPILGTVSGEAALDVAPESALLIATWGFVAEVAARILPRPVLGLWPGAAAWLRVKPSTALTAAPETPTPPAAASPGVSFDPNAAAHHPPPPPWWQTAPLQPSPPPPALSAAQRRRATLVALIGGGALVLVLAAFAVIQWMGTTYFGPSVVASEYLEDLKVGNATRAAQLADPGVPNADRSGLTDQVLQKATTRIDAIRVNEPSVNGETATVPVEYSIDGKKVETSLSARRDGSTWLFFPTWRLVSTLATPVSVTSPGGVNVGGIDLIAKTQRGSSAATVYLYPGTYQVTGASSGSDAKWFTYTSVPVAVEGGSRSTSLTSASVTITRTASPALVEEVRNQVRTLVDECAASTATRPTSPHGQCPFSTYSGDNKAQWKVGAYPEVRVDVDSVFGARVSTTTSGKVDVTTTSQGFFGSGPSTYTNSESFSVNSGLSVADDGSVHLQN